MVYFLKSELTGLIKIGYCGEKNLKTRSSALKYTGNGSLELLGVIHLVPMSHEKELHQKFSHLRVKGEWFTPAVELLGFIKENGMHPVFFRERMKPETPDSRLYRYKQQVLCR